VTAPFSLYSSKGHGVKHFIQSWAQVIAFNAHQPRPCAVRVYADCSAAARLAPLCNYLGWNLTETLFTQWRRLVGVGKPCKHDSSVGGYTKLRCVDGGSATV
jgi:hypothetical protein